MTKHIALIRGDGIGPEIIEQAQQVLNRVADLYGHEFTYTEVVICDVVGKAAVLGAFKGLTVYNQIFVVVAGVTHTAFTVAA